MKRPLIYAALSLVTVTIMAAAVYAFCVPTYITFTLAYFPCDEDGDHTIFKSERNYITFPDTATTYVDTEGFGGGPGGCQKNCDPDFFHPETSEGLWAQFVDDKEVHEDGWPYCQVVGERLYYAEHECRPSGTCGGRSQYGCNTGFTDLGGYCGRSYTFQSHCMASAFYDDWTCSCPDGWETSPIIVDVDNSGFSMTDAAHGVVFDILNDGVPLEVSWTVPSSTNAFIALDRNGNGTIDNGTELFGDITAQPTSDTPNGFVALAEYDKLLNGGNGDGLIDQQDSIFSSLRLWQDRNHNGLSEASELHSFSDFAIKSIDLNYKEAKRVDQYGNQFRYRAKVNDIHGAQGSRWAWDVFLKVQ